MVKDVGLGSARKIKDEEQCNPYLTLDFSLKNKEFGSNVLELSDSNLLRGH